VDDFDEFYRATHRRLLRQLALVTGDAGEAEDLLQEAYARAVLRWDQVRAFEAPEAWSAGSR
jgi:RNA polymerase sigma-70 factor (ECF subfamily)